MRFYVVSDKNDTYMGMRLAGMDGFLLENPQELRSAVERAVEDPDVGILLVTGRVFALCKELISDIKLNRKYPLIVEIPDRHSTERAGDAIDQYVREAVGIKI